MDIASIFKTITVDQNTKALKTWLSLFKVSVIAAIFNELINRWGEYVRCYRVQVNNQTGVEGK